MAFSNFPWGTCPTIHISYHLGEHYNSVRKVDDPCDGIPLVIGHELKIIDGPAKTDDVEEQKAASTPSDVGEVPSREELV